jgi:hypothetical protein
MSSPDSANVIPVTFLLDTGAINTIIMPADAARFHVDFHALVPANPILIGGHMLASYYINVWLDLVDQGSVYSYNINDARIVDPAIYGSSNPNILGQNGWGRWALHLEPGKVEIDPIKPDLKTP